MPLVEVLTELVGAMKDRMLVAHGAMIEVSALRRTTQTLFGVPLPLRSICTLRLERKLAPGLAGNGPYRLGAARERYGLPNHAAHDALTDAVTAAELLIAQLSRMPPDTRLLTLERA